MPPTESGSSISRKDGSKLREHVVALASNAVTPRTFADHSFIGHDIFVGDHYTLRLPVDPEVKSMYAQSSGFKRLSFGPRS